MFVAHEAFFADAGLRQEACANFDASCESDIVERLNAKMRRISGACSILLPS